MTTIIGGGHGRLGIAAALALAAASLPVVQVGTRREVDWWSDRKEPDNRGRRAEKDAIALAKAEAKRQRKAAKRAAKVGSGTTARREVLDELVRLGQEVGEYDAAPEGHNVEVRGGRSAERGGDLQAQLAGRPSRPLGWGHRSR